MNEPLKPSVGVIGLGLIGSIWARHLDADGLLSATWNRTPRADAPRPVGSARAVAEQADIVIVVVADGPVVRSILDAIQPALEPRHLVIQSSTIGPHETDSFRESVTKTGASYLEAPFTGSQPAAEARKLIYYLGGEPDDRCRAEPVLQRLSAQRIPCGTGKQACQIKVAMNAQIAIVAEALCESLHLCRAAGIEDELFFRCMKENAVWSGLAALKEPKLRAQDYAPQFSVKHLLKDLRLLQVKEGEYPACELLIERLNRLSEAGQSDVDFIALYEGLGADAKE